VEKRDQKIVVLGVEDGQFVSVSEPIFGLQISSGRGALALRARHPDTTKNSIFEWQVYRSAGRYVEKNTGKSCFSGKNHWKKSGLFLPKNFANFFRKTCFAMWQKKLKKLFFLKKGSHNVQPDYPESKKI
jgi:hypothetical protein